MIVVLLVPFHSVFLAIGVQPLETLAVMEGPALFACPLSDLFHCVMLASSYDTESSSSPLGFFQPSTYPLLEAATCSRSLWCLFKWVINLSNTTTMTSRAQL
jgi:hypothetical protein